MLFLTRVVTARWDHRQNTNTHPLPPIRTAPALHVTPAQRLSATNFQMQQELNSLSKNNLMHKQMFPELLHALSYFFKNY
ncbi:hypothetical protein ACRRTK_021545 [Alexandromys fortis]